MKKVAALRLSLCGALIAAATVVGCGDKMSDRHSEMSGGHESGTTPGIGDSTGAGPAARSDGRGNPIAGGKVNTVPDTLGYHDSTRTKPF